ncbi:3-alpha,7-alpha,12-alpha-trihydroxy-5-beta-cholest-24-enoyl-CoA hydratase [Actinophytocola xinjiangensis]|uniref:3-alpha,7-alpha, 12-alpha-trihydroxy-5-beta-cholest-24-enoyl-CoA hydratase n=1 Tax=Actinophytocola xinjiangensis TaxID=485602 RepID=A0A7Z0WNY2_9PSEU|nr:MaoC/PaaZ C-terminal domain-containing protein [Actinophytocola xinjiangensis]OLF11405.1 3-alpha,7-alpha,12-alpha-trihydroxy-5-beta-cholest-24-enoyl-CoA hydratase [Actinophytocola xinjiangensis]
MPIDPTVAIGADLGETAFAWTSSDVLLYHLALGAGGNPTDPRELRYVLEDRLAVLPTFGVVAPGIRTFTPPAVRFPGIEVDLRKVLHGTQSITVHGPIPAEGTAVARSRIADVLDKGTAAVIVQETAVSSAGSPLWTASSRIFVRDEGGFGGHRGPATVSMVPDREPDEVVEVATLPQQALLYRLCGDRNPLHADPEFAALAGFPRPILHGLCTYGMVCKSVVDTQLGGDPARVSGVATRFAGVCFPGETLRVRVWTEADRLIATATAPERDDAPVLADTVLTLT